MDDAYCHQVARRFRVHGYEHDDLFQEARLAMWRVSQDPRYGVAAQRTAAWNRLIDLYQWARRQPPPQIGELHDEFSHDPYPNVIQLMDFRASLPGLTKLEHESLAGSLEGEPVNKHVVSNARRKLRAAA